MQEENSKFVLSVSSISDWWKLVVLVGDGHRKELVVRAPVAAEVDSTNILTDKGYDYRCRNSFALDHRSKIISGSGHQSKKVKR